ncbi:hypothetical protein, partial [Streptomyces marianii]
MARGRRRQADDRIAKDLAHLPIAPHPFATTGHPPFPDRRLGHGLASWAWKTSLAFTDDFLARVGVQPVYEDLRPRLSTDRPRPADRTRRHRRPAPA